VHRSLDELRQCESTSHSKVIYASLSRFLFPSGQLHGNYPETLVQTGFQELPKRNRITQPLIVLDKADPFGVMTTQNGPNLDYAGSCARKPPNFAVALNCGIGSSFLNALVKALERLHIVRAENSEYSGSK